VRHLERLVDNLLDLSRLEAGPARRQPELWTLDSLLARALEQLGSDADRVSVDVGADMPPLRVDAAQTERVFVNLLENALKFSSPTDPVEVTATSAGGTVVVRIRDRGPGVLENDRERIFEPFERGSTTTRGTGLGLPIARGFARANGGDVSIEPSHGGATFAFALPVAAERPLRR
jgi:two-component system sensor histidine kinase KdpD